MQCKTVVLIENVPSGAPGPEHFRIEETTVSPPSVDGDVLVQVLVMSADPYLRGGIKAGPGNKKPGDAMTGFVAGKVLESRNANWKAGDLFGASLPFATVQLLNPEILSKTVIWNLTSFIDEAHISYGVGVLGMPGSTAYGGLIDVLKPNTGETIFVSAAAGAVGGLVGQIAKNVYGLKTIGSAGGAAKCELVKSKFGFDAAIDYKSVSSADELGAKLASAAPGGIDMYFENVGGMHLEAAFANLRVKGRIALCGMISQYNDAIPELNKLLLMKMIYGQQRIEGFMCMPWLSGQQGHFLADMSGWLKEGKLQVEETFFDGIEQWPVAFQSLFTGANTGKVVVRVA